MRSWFCLKCWKPGLGKNPCRPICFGFVGIDPKQVFSDRKDARNAVLCSTNINPFDLKFSRLFPGVLALLLSFPLYSPLSGQTFHPASAPLLTQEVALEQANECYLYLNNPSGDTLYLKWRQLELSIPDGWDIDLCDYGLCYIGIPLNGTMNPVFDTIQPYLKLIVQPGTTPGAAWCWFRVQEVDNATNFVDLYFSLFTPGTTQTGTADLTAIRVFPNPAQNFLRIDHQGLRTFPARLSDVTGRTVWQNDVLPNAQTHIDLAGWSAGVYFLQMGNQTRRIVVERP